MQLRLVFPRTPHTMQLRLVFPKIQGELLEKFDRTAVLVAKKNY